MSAARQLTALEHKCGTVAHINPSKSPMLLPLTVTAGTSASFLHLFLACVLKGSGFFRQACYRRIATARATHAPRHAANGTEPFKKHTLLTRPLLRANGRISWANILSQGMAAACLKC